MVILLIFSTGGALPIVKKKVVDVSVGVIPKEKILQLISV